jgi:hypothetical protein
MSQHSDTTGPVAHHASPELPLRALVFAGLAAGAIVVAAITRAGWTTALAAVSAAAALAGLVITVRHLRRHEGDPEAAALSRATAVLLATMATVTLVLAIVLRPVEARTTSAPTAAAAAQTVRDFLATAVLEDNAYLACQDLTPTAQRQVAGLAGVPTCREALVATRPTFDGIQSVGPLDRLDLRAAVHDGHASVTAVRHGYAPATFGLRPTTPAEYAAFQAPPAPWRIDSGYLAVLRHGRGPVS